MTGMNPDDVSKDQREVAKIISYSILYSGGSAYNVAIALGCTMEEATDHVNHYLGQFPVLNQFLMNLREKAWKTRSVRTFMNRRRRLEGNEESKVKNQACDAMGQQSIGTALKIALAKMVVHSDQGHPCMKGLSQIVPVFDAIFYCIDAKIPVSQHIMVMKDLVQLNMQGVVLEAEFETGPNWGSLELCDEEQVDVQVELMDGQAAIEQNFVPRETPEPPSEKEEMLRGLGLR
jgi:DNA polymerase I-like protein with 3'-5' exonuclease and polymerase domains